MQKIYHKTTGNCYEGEPVDCHELLASGAYTKDEPTEEDLAAVQAAAKTGDDDDVVVRNPKPAAAPKKAAGKK